MASAPLKVLFVSHTAEPGGAELAMVELVRGLAAGDAQVEVLLPAPGPLVPLLENAGARTYLARYSRWTSRRSSWRHRFRRLRANLTGFGQIARLARDLRPSVVVSNTLTVPSGAVAARWLGIPHVWFVHEFGRRDHGLRFDLGYRRTLRCIGRLSRLVLVNSDATGAEMAGAIPAEKLRRVYYAVDMEGLPEAPRPVAPGPLELILVGRMKPEKGQALAIEALGRLRERACEVRLHLVGHCRPDYREELSARSTQIGVRDWIEFTGFTPNPWQHLGGASVALMCSRDEAFGRVTVEAMKCGCAVVGARSGGTAELVRDGFNGMLFAPGDPDDLADKIKRLDADRPTLERLRENARRWARDTFRLDRYAGQVREVLREAIGGDH